MELETNLKLSLLFDIYKELLTEKQQKILKDFLDNNLSISELAIEYNSSRQAVNDLLKRSFKILEDYENKLGLLKKLEKIKNEVNDTIKFINESFSKQSNNYNFDLLSQKLEAEFKNDLILKLKKILEVM